MTALAVACAVIVAGVALATFIDRPTRGKYRQEAHP
ncbi:hypothetical protein CLV30_12875 [Haloactinopolyspora alba]|uniref:Uncharacterized protein n=1 Tax=Haloactinopolyspora alba TaxID=648780 RepID=A0A2P8DF25_9ACTN|nr:hypothetical protein CLV30_12875 [Haloactinopolyspora alba]